LPIRQRQQRLGLLVVFLQWLPAVAALLFLAAIVAGIL
jgi:hypothetical protein